MTRENGAIPYFTGNALSETRARERGKPVSKAFEISTALVGLKHTGPDGFNTPNWNQLQLPGSSLPQAGLDADTQYWLGCSPTAWGIVFGYWKLFKGKTNLFPSVDIQTIWEHDQYSSNSTMQAYMIGLAPDFGTTWSDNGGAANYFMVGNGHLYPQRRGYSARVITTALQINQWAMYDAAALALRQDRPCVMNLAVSGGQVTNSWIQNHTVVVEKARKTTYRDTFLDWWWWWWANGSVEFYVNLGYGSDESHRWICAVDVNPYYDSTGNAAAPSFIYDLIIE